MKQIKTKIEIAASPEKIWKILMDFEGWSKWNPIVNKIEGELLTGAILSITMADNNGKDAQKYKAKITELREPKKFSFYAIMMTKFIFSADRIITLETTEKGTLLTQTETFEGLMVSIFWGKLSTDARRMLQSMNEALKTKAEE